MLFICDNHNVFTFSERNGVCSTINKANEESFIQDCTPAIGVNAKIYKIINRIRYTSTNPNIAPPSLLMECKIGKYVTKLSMDAIICNTILVAKKMMANAIALYNPYSSVRECKILAQELSPDNSVYEIQSASRVANLP